MSALMWALRFVGDFHNEYLYDFDLNKKRTAPSLRKPLKNKISNNSPALSWKHEIGVTHIEFLNSSKLEINLKIILLLGILIMAIFYYFEINSTKTEINLNPEFRSHGPSKLVVDDNNETAPIIFGTNFGRITDIETGPDGFLYVLSYEDGKLYRILPT
jgi:aldose sugar dehydrogenase